MRVAAAAAAVVVVVTVMASWTTTTREGTVKREGDCCRRKRVFAPSVAKGKFSLTCAGRPKNVSLLRTTIPVCTHYVLRTTYDVLRIDVLRTA